MQWGRYDMSTMTLCDRKDCKSEKGDYPITLDGKEYDVCRKCMSEIKRGFKARRGRAVSMEAAGLLPGPMAGYSGKGSFTDSVIGGDEVVPVGDDDPTPIAEPGETLVPSDKVTVISDVRDRMPDVPGGGELTGGNAKWIET